MSIRYRWRWLCVLLLGCGSASSGSGTAGSTTTGETGAGTGAPTGVTGETGGATSPDTGAPTTGEMAPPFECGDRPGDEVEVSLQWSHACARRGCALQCWGYNEMRVLGHTELGWKDCSDCDEDPACCLGDDEPVNAWGDVDIGEPVLQVVAGGGFSCVRLGEGRVRCWGDNGQGVLGLGHTVSTPGGASPATRPDVKLGAAATQIAAGDSHVCAVLVGGAVRCWGAGTNGQLGYGDEHDVGDDEPPLAAGDVDVGGPVVQVAAGSQHTCAVRDDGSLVCWGKNYFGELGLGHTDAIGDDESPAVAGVVPVGAVVTQVAVAYGLTCVVTVEGAVRCWGYRVHGHPFAMDDPECIHCTDGPHCCIGDDELPQDVGDVELGGVAVQVAAGRNSACAVFAGGAALCWGQGRAGRLGNVPGSCAGLGIEPGPCWIGDDEAPAVAGLIDVGGEVVRIAVYDAFTCATLASGGIRCWGSGEFGLAGANESACCIGDDEPPAAAAELAVFDP